MTERNERDTAGTDWRARAACRGLDPELFFPAAEDGPARDVQVERAKAVCRRCPVREQCLRAAFDLLPYGIAGGLTEEERRRVRPRAGRPRRVPEVEEDRVRAGHHMLASGQHPREVAHRCRVSVRTAQRWARRAGLQAPVGAPR